MSTAILGIVALILILFIGMFATRRSGGGATVFELGRLFDGGVYKTIFVIILLPFLLIGLAAHNFWLWCTAAPPAPPPPLPVEGNDPIWGRERNKALASKAFVIIQEARTKRDPEIARRFLADLIYVDLQAECEGMNARHEINTRKDIDLEEVLIHKEEVDDQLLAGGTHSINWYFSARLRGTMTNFVSREDGTPVTGPFEQQKFEASMAFVRSPEPSDRWRVIYLSDLARSEDRIERLRQLK